MGQALPGMHYCAKHQGNSSHYAEHNCTVCQLQLNQELSEKYKQLLREARGYVSSHTRPNVSGGASLLLKKIDTAITTASQSRETKLGEHYDDKTAAAIWVGMSDSSNKEKHHE